MNSFLIWSIAVTTITVVVVRPKNWPEAIWASLGALILVVSGLLPLPQAGSAIAKGTHVYLFLTGMMLLSELARRKGVFDWLASHAAKAARGSGTRLFGLIYLVGIAVTVLLSNDATAVVLTPAVYAAVQRSRAKAMPYLLICAFVANAASFVLPISNPANLVVYGKDLPPLLTWIRTYFLPSVCSIAVTYLVLRWVVRKDLNSNIEGSSAPARLSNEGRLAAWGIAGTGLVLIAASGFGFDLGLPTFVTSAIAVLLATRLKHGEIGQILKGVTWSVLPLVAGLFVLVEAMNRVGATHLASEAFYRCAELPTFIGGVAAAFGVAGLSNVMNNLPSGLLSGGALQGLPVPVYFKSAVLIGVDLGPNLSVAGSLATVLWLIALRREGEQISGWQFLKTGFVVMPPALLLSVLAACLTS